MTHFLCTSPILLKCQYLMKCWTEFSHIQSEWSANGVVSNVTFYTNWSSKMAASAVTKNSKNILQTISHELPKGFCQNMCHTDAFIEFLMWRHKAGATQHSMEFFFLFLNKHLPCDPSLEPSRWYGWNQISAFSLRLNEEQYKINNKISNCLVKNAFLTKNQNFLKFIKTLFLHLHVDIKVYRKKPLYEKLIHKTRVR